MAKDEKFTGRDGDEVTSSTDMDDFNPRSLIHTGLNPADVPPPGNREGRPYGNLPVQRRSGPSSLRFEAQQYDAYKPYAFQPNMTVEALLGQGCNDANEYICERERILPGVVSNEFFALRSIDYPVVGPVGQFRASTEYLYARGKHMPDQFPLALVGANFEAEFFADDPASPVNGVFPWSLGCVMDWGVATLSFLPFDLTVQTLNWIGDDGQSLDRQFTIRVQRTVGSSIYVPWAQRIAPAMAMGQVQPAKPRTEEAGGSKIIIKNLPSPYTVPAGPFGAQVSFMTAFSPQTAAFASLTGLYGNSAG